LKSPLAMSDPTGPMPMARMTMNAPTTAMKAPRANAPPFTVRFQFILGADLSAKVASRLCVRVLPPGPVITGFVTASRATRCT
jgi:hypothetical protein